MYLHITQVHLDMASGFGKAHIEVGGGDSFRECTSTAAVGGRALDCEHTIINVTGTCMCIIRHIHSIIRMPQVKIFVYVYMHVHYTSYTQHNKNATSQNICIRVHACALYVIYTA